MHDPFDLGDAVIRDLPHVRVTRHAPAEGRACEFRKRFKPEGLGEAGYWVQRENDFLLDFTVKRLRHTVELAAFAQGGEGTPVVEWVATRDAGVTLEDWLRVQPRYANGAVWQHPFQQAGLFLHLLRACLVALQEIHGLGIVHCDIKEDNICLPFSPYPYAEGQSLRLDFERIKLIDFAFSLTPERPLAHPLPILPTAPYQSNLLKTALSSDQGDKNRGRLAVQAVDYRADLYSLGFLAGRILNAGLLQPAGAGGMAAMDGARHLVERLKGFDNSKRRGKTLPHGELIETIDALLEDLVDVEDYACFEVTRVRAVFTAGEEPTRERAGIAPTPLTPLATPLALAEAAEYRVATPPPPRRRTGWFVIPLALAMLAGAAVYWHSSKTPAPPIATATPPPTPAIAEDEAAKRAKLEAQWKQEAEAQYQIEEAKAKEEEARAKAEIAAEQRAVTRPVPTPPPVETPPPTSGELVADITYPQDGNRVDRAEEIAGSLEGLDEAQHAFLVIRSKADAFGKLYYPQGELAHTAEWTMKGIYATPNYEYETFVIATANPQSAELLRSQRSRGYGLKYLPADTRVISPVITVRRGE